MMVPERTASNPTEQPDEDLRERFLRVSLRWQLAQYEMVSLAALIEESGAWVGYAPSCAHWIAGALDMELCTAREWMRVGRALHDLPYIDAAFDSGLSYSKIRVLTRVATRENERELLELAYDTPAGRLGAVLAKWLGDREDPAETRARQRNARSVSWWIEPDGMVHGNFRLPAAEGKRLTTAIDECVRRAHLGGAPGHASADACDPWPSIVQQRADALVQLLTDGGAEFLTEVVIHLRGDGATFADGTPVPWPDLEGVLPESFVRALIHDADGRPINASGRQRHPTARQKAVVLAQHDACVDCGSTDFLEYDHDPPHAQTGHTVVDELVPRCWPCHRRRHDGHDAA